MTSKHDLTTAEGLRAYITSKHGMGPISVELLTGGSANFVYRVVDNDDSTVIYKYAAPFLQSNRDFAFNQKRIDYEARVLAIVPSMEDESLARSTHGVRLQHYNEDEKLLCIEDGGPHNLKEAYLHETLNLRGIGYDLAKWLATIHLQSATVSLGIDPSTRENNPIAIHIYRHSYNNLHTALAKYGYDISIAERINNEFGNLLASDDECVCHGDFWPGNVLVRQHQSDPLDPTSSNFELTIVDWEMVRRGTGATDIGQFAAEAFLLDRFHGDKGLRWSFLSSYIWARECATGAQQIGKEWIRRMAVHWAVHVAFWPTRVPWTDEEGTKELVDIGVKVLNQALMSDWEGLKASPLFADLETEWSKAFLSP